MELLNNKGLSNYNLYKLRLNVTQTVNFYSGQIKILFRKSYNLKLYKILNFAIILQILRNLPYKIAQNVHKQNKINKRRNTYMKSKCSSIRTVLLFQGFYKIEINTSSKLVILSTQVSTFFFKENIKRLYKKKAVCIF